MAKFYGAIGFAETVQSKTKPGVFEEEIVEHFYYGDQYRTSRRLQSADQLNDNVNVSNEISIVADPYANANFLSMRYVEFMGTKWKISNVDVRFPRLILTVGGLYNE